MAPHLPLSTLTVLVADDDADMRLYLRVCLQRMGAARVLEAADGHEALTLASGADLVVSDVRMPDLDGVALCRALKADARTHSLPVLLVSGEGALPPGSGAGGFLAKPFNAAVLRAEVARLLAPPP